MNQDLIVCQKCLHGNADTRNFCEKCGAPIGMFTTTSPFETIQAGGYACSEASSNPSKPIVVVGIWILFTPGVALLLFTLFRLITERVWREGTGWFLFYGTISTVLISKTTINFVKNKKKQETN